MKLQKTVKRNGMAIPVLQQDYFDGIEYRNDTLEAIYLSEGKVVFEQGLFKGFFAHCVKKH